MKDLAAPSWRRASNLKHRVQIKEKKNLSQTFDIFGKLPQDEFSTAVIICSPVNGHQEPQSLGEFYLNDRGWTQYIKVMFSSTLITIEIHPYLHYCALHLKLFMIITMRLNHFTSQSQQLRINTLWYWRW